MSSNNLILMIIKLKKAVQKLFNLFGYSIEKKSYKKKYNPNNLNLNIGSGETFFPGFINLDKISWRSKKQKNFVPFDITLDKLPYNNNTISNIYCSNVIEHLENSHVQNFLSECIRVLNRNGVLRLITPDPEFLYKNLFFKNSYWDWYKESVNTFNKKNYNHSFKIENFDCFVFHFAQQKSRFYQKNPDHEYDKFLKSLNYKDLMEELKKDLRFDEKTIHHHINYFDFNKLKIFLEKGSKLNNTQNYFIINSKKNGSVSSIMREKMFDYTSYTRSLYVDYIKDPEKAENN